jgi:hypothetical protein
MFDLPQPLHPALVHFPIVLIILGTGAAALSLVLDRWNIREWRAVLLVLAALGAVAATWSGGDQARQVRTTLTPEVKQLLHNHAEWGERDNPQRQPGCRCSFSNRCRFAEMAAARPGRQVASRARSFGCDMECGSNRQVRRRDDLSPRRRHIERCPALT